MTNPFNIILLLAIIADTSEYKLNTYKILLQLLFGNSQVAITMPEGNRKLDMLQGASYAGSKQAEDALKSHISRLEDVIKNNRLLRLEDSRSGSAVTDHLVLSEVSDDTHPNTLYSK